MGSLYWNDHYQKFKSIRYVFSEMAYSTLNLWSLCKVRGGRVSHCWVHRACLLLTLQPTWDQTYLKFIQGGLFSFFLRLQHTQNTRGRRGGRARLFSGLLLSFSHAVVESSYFEVRPSYFEVRPSYFDLSLLLALLC